MMKNILIFTLITGALLFWANGLMARFTPIEAVDTEGPIVIELFTSQSCSSCPPADKNLAKLSENANIIALGFHVTYWNHLHWKDTLSREFSTQRQRNYARAFKNGRVYTPQMVVNGQQEFVGSNGSRINTALKNQKPVKTIEVQKDGEALNVVLPSIKQGSYELWIAGLKDEHTQQIPSGENRGRTVTYKNAVISYQSGGAWDGVASQKTIKLTPTIDADRYAVLAQKKGFGKILAAGKTLQ